MIQRYFFKAVSLLICLSAIQLQVLSAQVSTSSEIENTYQRGLEALESGNHRDAIELWAAAVDDESDVSYKLGYQFIRTVTAHNFRDYYEQASRIYNMGLKDSALDDEDYELLVNDVEFIKPLIGRREANDWDDMIRERNPEILAELERFWNSMRLSISNDYNERLMEHWERKSYVANTYNTSSRSRFDDRGELYMRYGSPNFKRDGTLLYNSGFAEYVISARMRDGGGFSGNPIDATSFLNTSYMVREYHEYPMYEVWVYRDLVESDDNVVYIFGNSSGSAVMHKMESIDDFVPSAAFNISGRNNAITFAGTRFASGDEQASDDDEQDTDVAFESNDAVTANKENISPGLVLQLMYYRQMATFDEYFNSRYTDMMDRYMSTSTYLGKSISKEFQHVNTSRLLRRQGRAPNNSSSHAKEIFTIPSELFTYRFLDENMSPYLNVFLKTETEEAISYEELRNHNSVQSIDESNYLIVNRLEAYDRSGSLENSVIDTLLVASTSDPLSNNVIEIQHSPDLDRLSAKFELHNQALYGEGAVSERTTFRNYQMGLGQTEAEPGQLLENGSFTSSDVILGFKAYNDSTDSNITLAHDAVIPYSNDLILYYEAYNLPENEDGLYSYTLTSEISKNRSFVGNLIRFGKSSGPSITIDNVNDESRFTQMLEIASQDLERGEYLLKLTFETPDDEIIQTKEIEFQII